MALCTCLAAVLRADERSDVLDLVQPLAAAMSDGNAGDFMAHLPQDAPDRDLLEGNIKGLLDAASVTSSVKVQALRSGEADLLWQMQIVSRATKGIIEQRRAVVTMRYEGKHIRALQPASAFAPPAL